jgi:hypothetical protein
MTLSYKYLWSALFISVIIGIVVYIWIPLYSFQGVKKALEGVLLLSSISLGFYGACLSVFASIFNTRVVRDLMRDNQYRREFILVSGISLSSGFFTVFTTITYQVLLENEGISEIIYKITNSIWLALTFMFLFYNVLFVLVSFLIFFSNNDEESSMQVHSGKVKKQN